MAPNLPVVSEGGAVSELETIGQRMLAALSALRIGSLSLHDERGDVLWLNESVMGPDEHEAVRAALEAFAGEGTSPRYEHDLGDGRVAVALRASHRGVVLGLAMVVLDGKALATHGARERSEAMLLRLHEPLEDLATWLNVDVSATQTRIHAMSADVDEHMARLPYTPEESLATGVTPAAAPPDPGATEDASQAAAPAGAGDAAPRPDPAGAPSSLATHTGSPPGAGSAAAPVDPGVDRHFAALRALPIVLYTQRLEPMRPGSRIRRFEILLRTESEHGRAQAPVAMLDAAVKRGLGSVIDRRVVTELITWLARHPEAWRTDPVLCSVNLSPSALADDHFLKFLELCLAKARLPRGMLAFELDAQLCAQHLERSANLSQILAAFGCSLIIDDFSLRDPLLELLALKGLRMLKLHAALTTNLSADKRRQAIVAGIAQMARVLGMHTCAKRIETRTDQRWLAALKIDFAQGFAFSEPLPLESLLAER